MTDRNTDMRRIADQIAEAGLAAKAADAVAAGLGSKTAGGRQDTRAFAKQMYNAYKTYLGRIGKKPDETNLLQFLIAHVGFGANDARELFQQVGIQDPIMKTESIILELDGSQIQNLFTAAAQMGFEKNIVRIKGDKGDKHGYGLNHYGNGYRRNRSQGGSQSTPKGATKPEEVKTPHNSDSVDPAAAKPKAAKPTNNSIDKNKMLALAKKLGLDEEEIADLNSTVDDPEFVFTNGDRSTINQLAIIGYAFLKANGK